MKRLTQRRYDPSTGRVVNLTNLPADVPASVASKWKTCPSDAIEVVSTRLQKTNNLFAELESVYKLRKKNTNNFVKGSLPPLDNQGIMQRIDEELITPSSKYGPESQDSITKVFETIQDILLRPINNTYLVK